MKRQVSFTVFDALTGVPSLLHYVDIEAITWRMNPEPHQAVHKATVRYKNGAIVEINLRQEDAADLREWIVANGAVHIPVFFAPSAAPSFYYHVPKFVEKRGGNERRRKKIIYGGQERRQGDRRKGGR
jgi:hypothetical protein